MPSSARSYRRTPHVHKNRFFNYPGESTIDHSLFVSLYLLMRSFCTGTAAHKKALAAWATTEPLPPLATPAITWLGPATFLLRIGGWNIITDPIFGNATCFFPRLLPCGIAPTHLPPIDCVIISHNHRDHMDKASLLLLKQFDPLILVPQGDGPWFKHHGFTRVQESTWSAAHSLTPTTEHQQPLTCTFLPAHHWSQRTLFDRNRSLWGSWMITTDEQRIYFAGDTAYAEHFAEIGSFFGPIDLALMPIAPCEPHAWMKNTHMNAEEAGQAFIDLQARAFIPMHWGTFHFGSDTPLDPIERLIAWWQQNRTALADKELVLAKAGHHIPLIPPLSTALIQPSKAPQPTL